MNEYLNPQYILAETETRIYVMMHLGNGDKVNITSYYRLHRQQT